VRAQTPPPPPSLARRPPAAHLEPARPADPAPNAPPLACRGPGIMTRPPLYSPPNQGVHSHPGPPPQPRHRTPPRAPPAPPPSPHPRARQPGRPSAERTLDCVQDSGHHAAPSPILARKSGDTLSPEPPTAAWSSDPAASTSPPAAAPAPFCPVSPPATT